MSDPRKNLTPREQLELAMRLLLRGKPRSWSPKAARNTPGRSTGR